MTSDELDAAHLARLEAAARWRRNPDDDAAAHERLAAEEKWRVALDGDAAAAHRAVSRVAKAMRTNPAVNDYDIFPQVASILLGDQKGERLMNKSAAKDAANKLANLGCKTTVQRRKAGNANHAVLVYSVKPSALGRCAKWIAKRINESRPAPKTQPAQPAMPKAQPAPTAQLAQPAAPKAQPAQPAAPKAQPAPKVPPPPPVDTADVGAKALLGLILDELRTANYVAGDFTIEESLSGIEQRLDELGEKQDQLIERLDNLTETYDSYDDGKGLRVVIHRMPEPEEDRSLLAELLEAIKSIGE